MIDSRAQPRSSTTDTGDGRLIRGVGLWHATTLNMIDMIGVGPFVTMPLMIAAMHGPARVPTLLRRADQEARALVAA